MQTPNGSDRTPGGKRRRKRRYTLYSLYRRPTALTNRYRAYVHGAHVWKVEVYARSIRQAYYLAGNEIYAAAPGAVGVRRIEPHHRLRDELRGVPPPPPTLAPYLAEKETDGPGDGSAYIPGGDLGIGKYEE